MDFDGRGIFWNIRNFRNLQFKRFDLINKIDRAVMGLLLRGIEMPWNWMWNKLLIVLNIHYFINVEVYRNELLLRAPKTTLLINYHVCYAFTI